MFAEVTQATLCTPVIFYHFNLSKNFHHLYSLNASMFQRLSGTLTWLKMDFQHLIIPPTAWMARCDEGSVPNNKNKTAVIFSFSC